MATSDIVIEVNGKPTDNSAGGFLDTITDLNFNSLFFFVEIYGGLDNDGSTADAVPTPSAVATALNNAKLVWKALSPTHVSTDTYTYFVGSLDHGPWSGVGRAAPADAPVNNRTDGMGSNWTGRLGAFLSLVEAQTYLTFVSAGNILGAETATAWTGTPPIYFRRSALSYDYFFKIKNDKSQNQVSLELSGIAAANQSASVNINLWTTGDHAGTKNFTAKQIAKIKQPSDIALMGVTPDAQTGYSSPPLADGMYNFTFWRDLVKPPLLLYQGAHIKATAPIPSV